MDLILVPFQMPFLAMHFVKLAQLFFEKKALLILPIIIVLFIYLLYFAKTSYNKLQRLMDWEKKEGKKRKKTGRVTTTVRTHYHGPWRNGTQQ